MESPLDIFISILVNNCGYEGPIFFVEWVHPLLLMAHAEDSKEDNLN